MQRFPENNWSSPHPLLTRRISHMLQLAPAPCSLSCHWVNHCPWCSSAVVWMCYFSSLLRQWFPFILESAHLLSDSLNPKLPFLQIKRTAGFLNIGVWEWMDSWEVTKPPGSKLRGWNEHKSWGCSGAGWGAAWDLCGVVGSPTKIYVGRRQWGNNTLLSCTGKVRMPWFDREKVHCSALQFWLIPAVVPRSVWLEKPWPHNPQGKAKRFLKGIRNAGRNFWRKSQWKYLPLFFFGHSISGKLSPLSPPLQIPQHFCRNLTSSRN